MSFNVLPRRNKWLYPRTIKEGHAHSGSIEQILTQETAGLAYRLSANSHSYNSIFPTGAPYAQVTAIGTLTGFWIGSLTTSALWCKYQVPWIMQNLYTSFDVRMVVAAPSKRLLSFGMSTIQMNDAMTEEDLDMSHAATPRSGPATAPALWARTDLQYVFHKVSFSFTPTPANLPSSGIFALRPNVVDHSAAQPLAGSTSYYVYVVSLTIKDYYDRKRA